MSRWDDTDPDTWPEWADVPIPFVLAQPKRPPAGRITRRTVLGLATGSILAFLGTRTRVQAEPVPGPLARAYRTVLEGRAESRRIAAQIEAMPDDSLEASRPIEARLREAHHRESDAILALIDQIVVASGVRLDFPPRDWDLLTDLPYRAVAGAREGRALYLLVAAEDSSPGTPYRDTLEVRSYYRPVVLDLGGLA